MIRVVLLLLPVLLAGCNLGNSNVKPDDRQVVVRASCGLGEKFSGDCLAHPPMKDLANAQAIAQAIDRITVTARTEVVAGQQVSVFGSMAISPPPGLLNARDMKKDKDAAELVGSVVRFASNLSTPSAVIVQNAGQRDFANHLLREWRTTSVAVSVGDGKTITVKRQ